MLLLCLYFFLYITFICKNLAKMTLHVLIWRSSSMFSFYMKRVTMNDNDWTTNDHFGWFSIKFQFRLNVIASLIWEFFFHTEVSRLEYVATFSGQLDFKRSYFFTLLYCNYFETTVTFPYFFWSSYFFRTVTYSEYLLFQSKTSTK